jgi:hypothetical protein
MPVLTYLRASQLTWERGQDTFGDGRNTAVARLATIGHIERRPYDYTQLAAATRLSRQNVMRRCLTLSQDGWVTIKRDEVRVLVLPTEKLLGYWEDQVVMTSPVLSRWAKVATMLGLVTLVSAAPVPVRVVAEVIAGSVVAAEEVREVERGSEMVSGMVSAG